MKQIIALLACMILCLGAFSQPRRPMPHHRHHVVHHHHRVYNHHPHR